MCVGIILRIYDPKYDTSGQLEKAHWVIDKGLFVTLHTEDVCTFVDLVRKPKIYLL